MTCDRCYQSSEVGAHGLGLCPLEPRREAHTIITDDIPGGQWFENGFREPQQFYSKQAHREALAAQGRVVAAKWVPGDKYLTRWDTVDLAGAKALLEACGTAAVAETRKQIKAQTAAEFPIVVTNIGQ